MFRKSKRAMQKSNSKFTVITMEKSIEHILKVIYETHYFKRATGHPENSYYYLTKLTKRTM